jgi:ATP-dependent Clp protease protease subunit
LISLWKQFSDPSWVFETWVDKHLEAGYETPAIDPEDPLLEKREILITASINERTSREVVERLLFLDALDGNAPIELFISTQGGWGDSAFTIVDAMNLIEAPVNTHAIGGCYSAGAMILAAGTGIRRATENAIIMVHANVEESSEAFSFERHARERYERLWSEQADLPDEWFPMTQDTMYYLSAEEALRFGIIDEIRPRSGGSEAP